jgi:hypothetical protein
MWPSRTQDISDVRDGVCRHKIIRLEERENLHPYAADLIFYQVRKEQGVTHEK